MLARYTESCIEVHPLSVWQIEAYRFSGKAKAYLFQHIQSRQTLLPGL